MTDEHPGEVRLVGETAGLGHLGNGALAQQQLPGTVQPRAAIRSMYSFWSGFLL